MNVFFHGWTAVFILVKNRESPLTALSFLCRVFELNPQIKKMMPEFMTADPIAELNSSRKLFGHSKTLMKCLENAVTSLDDNESFVAYLVELGRRHQVRPLKAQYLEVSNVRITRISTHCLSLYKQWPPLPKPTPSNFGILLGNLYCHHLLSTLWEKFRSIT